MSGGVLYSQSFKNYLMTWNYNEHNGSIKTNAS